jgi:hypothetical protein
MKSVGMRREHPIWVVDPTLDPEATKGCGDDFETVTLEQFLDLVFGHGGDVKPRATAKLAARKLGIKQDAFNGLWEDGYAAGRIVQVSKKSGDAPATYSRKS